MIALGLAHNGNEPTPVVWLNVVLNFSKISNPFLNHFLASRFYDTHDISQGMHRYLRFIIS